MPTPTVSQKWPPDITLDGSTIEVFTTEILLHDDVGLIKVEIYLIKKAVLQFLEILKDFKNHQKWTLSKYTI